MSKENYKQKALALFNHSTENCGNVFFGNGEEARSLGLEAQAVVAIQDPKILRSNLNILLGILGELTPASEMQTLRYKANLAVQVCKDRWERATRPVVYNLEAIATLRRLFTDIGWGDWFERSLEEECAVAYIQGMIDNAYDQWADASDYTDILEKEGTAPEDINIWSLSKRFPETVFDNDEEYGLRYDRGRLFSLRDYHEAKEAVGLIRDKFSQQYEARFGALPEKYYLFD